jgi:metal-sulfur cluster biosynthetic enzyme
MADSEDVYLALSDVYDPEVRMNIVDLGLIYNVKVSKRTAHIQMTFTSPNCPAVPEIKNNIIRSVGNLNNVDNVKLEYVWDPPWDASRMSEEAKLELGYEVCFDENGKEKV